MAWELLHPRRRPRHRIDHDLESVFWLLLYVCLIVTQGSKDSSDPEGVQSMAREVITTLNGSVRVHVVNGKVAVLDAPEDIELGGTFKHAQPSLRQFAYACNTSRKATTGPRLTFDDVDAIFKQALHDLPPRHAHPPASSTGGQKRTWDDEFEGDAEIRHASGSSKRSRTGRSSRGGSGRSES